MVTSTGLKAQLLGLPREQLCRRFSLAEIQSATQNFDEDKVIGRGVFGKLYRGTIDGSNSVVAIKRLEYSGSKQGSPEFWAQIEMLSNLRHCHLVTLIGYCNDPDEMIFVYDLIPNGTLADHLHKNGSPLSTNLAAATPHMCRCSSWLGLPALRYRYPERSRASTCEELKHFVGLTKIGPPNQPYTFVSTAIKGNFVYLDPNYFSTGSLTIKSDVYAFGVVLLELLCGRSALDKSLDHERWILARWAQDYPTRKTRADY